MGPGVALKPKTLHLRRRARAQKSTLSLYPSHHTTMGRGLSQRRRANNVIKARVVSSACGVVQERPTLSLPGRRCSPSPLPIFYRNASALAN